MRTFPQGVVHQAAGDFQAAVEADARALVLWGSLTPLAQNEFLCWVEDAKRDATRRRRIARTLEMLLGGKRRPCCWAGCAHRTDKAPRRWRRAVMNGD